MRVILETERTFLREFSQEDAGDFYEMNNDPEVIKYTGDPPFSNIHAASEFIKSYNTYSVFGYGRWAVCDKFTNEFLGFCGLKFHPKENLVEIGYRLKRKYWGKGYATESTIAVIKYGFKKFNFNAIYGFVENLNTASYNVLIKCGLELLFKTKHDGKSVRFYRVLHPDIKIKAINAEETISVRHAVLRPGKSISSCNFEGDQLESTVHFGLFAKNKLAAIASFYEKKNPLFNGSQIQLRGMAVLENYKAKGFGRLLLETGEQLATQKKSTILWFNARIAAIPFYEKYG
ncbi:GNAT family N-acetyltransferase, partial [uncultured Planktosalinus sp.]|uniref:GNAT family N-acetyltransferase n=1 Tax=uncultured Planktosalinus sp. TaxID=1810935 RepID=UPI0030DBA01D